MTDDPEHVALNRAAWDVMASDYVDPGRRAWESDAPCWGTWQVPDSELHILPDVDGLDTIELGCGTAYVSAWLARRGAHPVGIDNSPNQLATASSLQREHGLDFPLLLGNAETVPLPDASFDLAISEYGAALWCDPYKWIPEAARLLRPGGQLIFYTNGCLLVLCEKDDEDVPVEPVLRRAYFGLHRTAWSDQHTVEFHLGYGDWIRLLRANGFEVENLIEVRPPEGATTRYPYVDLAWARRWPSEEAWIARKRQ
ncbi:MAG: class I SAM-dependent methyltransferase [Candidatus Dormibacteraeota bacterium]|uniref:Class I SAM-dependent methyltransferase n=1 Tax=Candidatus Amunia macphersoniae TaxID=3127014 RepID=A0A934KMB6_9BACT|nr:class I SAM-dependent methyltransferase [Candidatus Dormibacteraeota bacterium]